MAAANFGGMEITGPWTIRSIESSDQIFLRRMLYMAIYVPPGEPPLLESIVEQPELEHYVLDFGARFGDMGVLAVIDDEPVAACWLRLFSAVDPGYGYVSDDVPELSIAVVPQARGRGLGTALIESALSVAAEADFERVSLSVDGRSAALALYERLGFEHVGWEGTSMTMTRPSLGL